MKELRLQDIKIRKFESYGKQSLRQWVILFLNKSFARESLSSAYFCTTASCAIDSCHPEHVEGL